MGGGGNGGEKVAGERWWLLPGEDVVGDFPSAVVGVGDSDSQTSACFQPCSEVKQLNIRAVNRRGLDKLKQSGHRLAGD